MIHGKFKINGVVVKNPAYLQDDVKYVVDLTLAGFKTRGSIHFPREVIMMGKDIKKLMRKRKQCDRLL